MKYLLILLLSIPVLCLAQSRDTTITRTIYYLDEEIGNGICDTATVWSSELSGYITYSRINMGQRMNRGIKYNKLANTQFKAAVLMSTLSAASFVITAYSDPVIYIEYHPDYTRDYFDNAKCNRNAKIAFSSALAAGAVYLFWRSNKNYKKSRWHISPDGVKFRF